MRRLAGGAGGELLPRMAEVVCGDLFIVRAKQVGPSAAQKH
jgi:hypothetical protein